MAERGAATGQDAEQDHGPRRARWARRRAWIAVVVAGAASVALGAALATRWPELAHAQRVTGPNFGEVLARRSTIETAMVVDLVFMAAYGIFGRAAFSLVPDRVHRSRAHPAAIAGTVLLAAGVAADLAENTFLFLALEEGRGSTASTLLGVMRAAGLVKWGLLGAAALTLGALLAVAAWREPPVAGRPTDRPERDGESGPDPWDPPAAGSESKVGICLSGGGVRSAAFSLGALQALRARGILARARYLTAASGGGYLAAGWSVSHAGAPGAPAAGPLHWDPGSPEERWFRDHSSYLVPSVAGGLGGMARLIAGVVVNLLLVWLVLFAVARPFGWVIHTIHPGMWDDDVAVVRDGTGDVQIAGSPRPVATFTAAGGAAVTRYEVALAPAPGNEVCLDVEPYDRATSDACFPVVPFRTGLIDLRDGRATVVRQPAVRVGPAGDDCTRGCGHDRSLVVTAGPRLRLATPVVTGDAELRAAVALARQPKVESTSGLAATRYPEFSWWMGELSGGLLLAALGAALAATTVRLRPRREAVLRSLAAALAGAGLLALAVTVVLPWLAVWVPRTLASAFEALPGAQEVDAVTGTGFERYLLPTAGFLATVLAAARQFLASGRKSAGTGPSRPWYSRIWERLSRSRAQLKWYETSPSKILLAVVLPLAALVLLVFQVRDAAAQGWTGRQMGWSTARQYLPYELWPAEWLKLAGVGVLLAAFAVTVDAHAWSLYPFYKRRLSSAFLVRRTGDGRAETLDYDLPLPFTPSPAAPGWKGLPGPGQPGGPQLVLCCAVNLSQYGVVPPGRRAASFTFSSTEIGGPLVGYKSPGEYWQTLPGSRRRDLTVPSAMAISGAAFSPAMGKFNLGPVGSVLAVGNLRLGVWLPNPCRLHEGAPAAGAPPRRWWWKLRRPGWTWFVRELLNAYLLERRYVYVSDGGHWDNLGLVELFRRGCTEIYCVSCAGDGPESFGTIAEAMALAREELGVEVLLDPSPLRSPTGGAATGAGGRELRRVGAKDAAAPFAQAPAVAGSFTYTWCDPPVTGTVWYVEADLTGDMPFDVHAFAEAEPVFPDDSTGDQVFNHRQFESYRRLGYHQADAMGRT